jgi:DNA replication and repair protein RecF
MRLTHLSLHNFRNYARLDLEVPAGNTLIVGRNAQGKTSLLEAIYMLATFASFHAENDRELIHFDAQPAANLTVARIVAHFVKARRSRELELRIIREPTGFNGYRVRKEVLLDKQKFKLNEALGALNAVLFLPQMLQVVDGSPHHRRRYLDLALAQVVPQYPAVLAAYNKVVTQRNALLKQLSERGGDPEQLAYWDQELASLGARLIRARIAATQEIELLAAQIHLELTRGAEVLRLDYRPAYDPLRLTNGQLALQINDPKDRAGFAEDAIQHGFAAALRESRAEEIARGVTTLGPHRDELRFICNGRVDLGTYGSRGQVRTTMLTLKLAEVAWMKHKTGHWPLLLLDEVLAELDDQRRADLLARMAACEQVLATTTDLGMFDADFVAQARVWQVEGGRVTL